MHCVVCAWKVSAGAWTAGAGSIHAGTVDLGDGLAEDVIWHAWEFLRDVIIHHGIVKSRLRLGAAELGAAANLAKSVDGLARHRLTAHGFRLGVGLPD